MRMGILSSILILWGANAMAQMTETYLAPGTEATSFQDICGGQATCSVGTETFNNMSTGDYTTASTPITTNFGTYGAITGSISGNYTISPATQWGGANGTGNYIVTYSSAGYTLNLNSTISPTGGVNYFGMELMSLDAGNNVSFYNGNTLVATYTPANLISALGSCPSSYCGNPNGPWQGANGTQQYAFINFYDTAGTFNKVVFTETPQVGGYEADNFTVAYTAGASTIQGTIVPAPLPLLGASIPGILLGLGAFKRKRV